MKTLNTMILAIGAVVGTTGLNAQTKAVANIPFDFTVSSVTMPAGEYTLQSASAARNMIQIINHETGKSALVLLPDTDAPKGTGTGRVTFNRYEDRYFFSGVWTPDGLRGHAMPGKLEQELQASKGEKEMASLSIPLTAAAR
jgi:hypothetical protein